MGSTRVETAVILAGGTGSRLLPFTIDRPKPMVELLGKPLLQWVVEWIRSQGILNIVIGVAYCKESVIKHFGNGAKFGVRIKYSVHSVEGETGEGFRLAISRYVKDDLFFCTNGDEITDFSMKDFINYHSQYDALATIAVTNPQSPFGLIRTDRKGLVLSFEEKPVIPSILVSIGAYLFDRRILEYLPEKGSIESTTFPLL